MKEKLYSYKLSSGKNICLTILKGTYKRKYISIRITHDGQVIVLLPIKACHQDALQAIHKKETWISEHLDKISTKSKPLQLSYKTGEKHLYLGNWYTLLILKEQKTQLPLQERISFNHPFMKIIPTEQTSIAVKNLLERWYRNEIKQIITHQITLFSHLIPWLHKIKKWNIKRMRCCWGSCTQHGVITVNMHLIKAPRICLNYVLLHELIHLKEHNHSHQYYSILSTFMPSWKKVKAQLEDMAPFILNF